MDTEYYHDSSTFTQSYKHSYYSQQASIATSNFWPAEKRPFVVSRSSSMRQSDDLDQVNIGGRWIENFSTLESLQ